MRKLTASILICLLGTLLLVGCKKDSKDEFPNVVNMGMVTDEIQKESDDKNDDISTEGQQTEQITEEQKPSEAEEDGGGNEFSSEKKEEVIKISVLVNKEEYFCDNTPMELEEIISKVKEVKGSLIVEVNDNNATLKAYNKLLDKLEELEITVIEK